MEDISCIVDTFKHTKLLSRQEEYDLISLAQKGDVNARNKIVLANLRWVYRLAQRNAVRETVPMEELFQVGVLGLMRAIDHFDPGKEKRLTTYSAYWIKEAMQQENERRSEVIALPKKYSFKKLKDDKSKDCFERVLDGILSLDFRGTEKHKKDLPSVREQRDFQECEELIIEDAALKDMEREEVLKALYEAIEWLPRTQKTVVKDRLDGLPFSEIAKSHSLTTEGVRMRYLLAIQFLKEYLLARGIEL